jgi:uncharacterized protein YprB with RNaseH-like and TPR domain
VRVVAWDLECTSLSALVGRVLCCSFKPIVDPEYAAKSKVKPYTFRGDVGNYASPKFSDDRELVVAIRDELEKYDIIVGHNSKLFDKKFLNGRLAKWWETPLQSMWHIDTMWAVRSHMKISSKLDNIQKHMGLKDEKTPISWDDWADAAGRDERSMDEVVKHCEQDVKVLEQVYWRLMKSGFVRQLKRD